VGETTMAERIDHPLAAEISAYEKMKADLQKNHTGKFVVIREGALVGTWDTLDAAAQDAVRRFGRGPYLIRQVGAPPPFLPASVMFRESATA
jgi:hypothetical protein